MTGFPSGLQRTRTINLGGASQADDGRRPGEAVNEAVKSRLAHPRLSLAEAAARQAALADANFAAIRAAAQLQQTFEVLQGASAPMLTSPASRVPNGRRHGTPVCAVLEGLVRAI
jgi:hypothetical protein